LATSILKTVVTGIGIYQSKTRKLAWLSITKSWAWLCFFCVGQLGGGTGILDRLTTLPLSLPGDSRVEESVGEAQKEVEWPRFGLEFPLHDKKKQEFKGALGFEAWNTLDSLITKF